MVHYVGFPPCIIIYVHVNYQPSFLLVQTCITFWQRTPGGLSIRQQWINVGLQIWECLAITGHQLTHFNQFVLRNRNKTRELDPPIEELTRRDLGEGPKIRWSWKDGDEISISSTIVTHCLCLWGRKRGGSFGECKYWPTPTNFRETANDRTGPTDEPS